MREDHNKGKFDLERRVKEAQRARNDLENEVRKLANDLDRVGDDHFANKMALDKESSSEFKRAERHTEEQEEFTKLQNKKTAVVKKLDDDLAKNNAKFMAIKELQDALNQSKVFREEIQQFKVKV